MRPLSIGPYILSPHHPPLIVAEVSANHKGSIEEAFRLIDAAKEAGVHAIKFQTYTPDTLTLDVYEGDFVIRDPQSPWYGRNLYDLYQEAYTPWEWHKPLFNHCRKVGLVYFSTPFDETAVDFLETLNVPCYKIASLEIVDLPLIAKVAATKKPLIISTGGATLKEIQEAVTTAKEAGCRDLILLKCTAAYPSLAQDCHLRTIPDLMAQFDTLVGLSDHTLSLGVPLASVALGACLIEKHFTLTRQAGGVDSAFSLEPAEFKELVAESKKAFEALGRVTYETLPSEKTTLSLRPSLFFIVDLPAGSRLTADHVRSVRPSTGLPPKEFNKIVGKELKTAVKKGTPVQWHLFN